MKPVEAVMIGAASGDRQIALQALLLDLCINDLDTARAILTAYLREFADYLLRFQARQ